MHAITTTYTATGIRKAAGSPPCQRNAYIPTPISSVTASTPRRGNSPTPMRNSAMYARCASRKHTSPGTNSLAEPHQQHVARERRHQPGQQQPVEQAFTPPRAIARRAAKKMAMASASGLHT
jgi:hypothetical protein